MTQLPLAYIGLLTMIVLWHLERRAYEKKFYECEMLLAIIKSQNLVVEHFIRGRNNAI